nr:hypothetical protein [Tanacetum cinerariifolium]
DVYCNGGYLPRAYLIGNSLHYQDLEWYKKMEIHEINYRNYDEHEYGNKTHDEGHELCGDEAHEMSVFQIKIYKMIKYSFNNDKEYVVVKEDEYDDLTITREEACRAYQEIFRMIFEGGMVTRIE